LIIARPIRMFSFTRKKVGRSAAILARLLPQMLPELANVQQREKWKTPERRYLSGV